MSKTRMEKIDGEDVYDLPDEMRDSLDDPFASRDVFARVGIDDYMDTDKVLAGNGERYFITKL